MEADQTVVEERAGHQKAYRRRAATVGETVEPAKDTVNSATHLDEIAGVLHYCGSPIIPIDKARRWPGFGNRHVGMLPLDAYEPLMRAGASGYQGNHLFECLECRRWSVGRGWVFCSRKCRLAYRAAQARERRGKVSR